MEFETLLVDSTQGVTTISLNRPDRLNAYTVMMGEELVEIMEKLRVDENCKAIIITGEGKGFCAGVDLDELKNNQKSSSSLPKLGQERLVQAYAEQLYHFPKPLIAAFNGAAIGVGVTMTLPFDIRIASKRAKFGVPFAKLGIIPGLGSTHLLPRIVGRSNASFLLMTGRTIDAETARNMGLIDLIVEDEELIATAKDIATDIAKSKPEIITSIKKSLNFGIESVDIRRSIAFEHNENAKR